MRPEVAALVALGPLPGSSADAAVITTHEAALRAIERPVTRQEAIALATCFGPGDCFGLAWALVHLIESAPGGALTDDELRGDNEWIALLRERRGRGR